MLGVQKNNFWPKYDFRGLPFPLGLHLSNCKLIRINSTVLGSE